MNSLTLSEINPFTPRTSLDAPKEINGIPLTIYMTWHSKQVPPQMKECIHYLISMNPEFDVNIYDEAMCKEFIEKHFPDKPDVLTAFTTLKPYSYKSDLWRFCVLWLFGGIYMDIKFYSVVPLIDLIRKHGEIFVKDYPVSSQQCESKVSILTGFIVSKPGNPIFMNCIDEIIKTCKDRNLKESALSMTGPCLLGKVVASHLSHNSMSSIMFNYVLDSTMKDSGKAKIVYNNIDIIKQYEDYRAEQRAVQVNGEYYADKWKKGNVFHGGDGSGKGRRSRKGRKLTGGEQKKDFIFYNQYHYGDQIFNLKFLYNITNKLKEKGIKIKYLYDTNYIKNLNELERYRDPEVVTLEGIGDKLPEGAVQLWMGNPLPGNNPVSVEALDDFFPLFYANILNHIGLENNNIDTSLYQDEPYLQDIYNKLDPKFKDLDILIINAAPQSGQVVYHIEKFSTMCIQLSKKYRVAITSPIEGQSIPCTMSDKLSLQDIGAISTHAKYIIAIHSGPLVPCFNAATKKNVKKWILFADNKTHHSKINAVTFTNDYDYATIEKNIN